MPGHDNSKPVILCDTKPTTEHVCQTVNTVFIVEYNSISKVLHGTPCCFWFAD